MEPTLRTLACLVGLVLAAGCGDDDTTSDAEPVPELEAGDCIADITPLTSSGALDGLEIVDCMEVHEAEVYGTIQIEGSSYPGRDAVQEQMISTCDELYEEYPGASESRLAQTSFIPNEAEWDQGIRTIVCFLETPKGRSGSVAGEGRPCSECLIFV